MDIKELSKEQLIALSELKLSEGWKIIDAWQKSESQKLKESSLCLDDIYIEVMVGQEQKHIKKVTIAEQLKELQGRQNQMISERAFINAAISKLGNMRKKKKKR